MRKIVRLRRWAGPLGAFVVLAAVPLAFGATVVISDTNLSGGDGTNWDPVDDTYACTNPGPPDGFVPVDDGQTTTPSRHDAFDDGFVVWVGGLTGTIFHDPDGNGNRRGHSLSVGPHKTDGFVVSQTETALQTSPTLRMLYRFKNPKRHRIRRLITVETNLGSDSGTGVRGSSTGDLSWTKTDRWLVTSDNSTTPTDPPVTQVWYGKHAAERVVHTDQSEVDCYASDFRIAVPPHATRDLMFFAEMNPDSNADALHKAAKFDRRHLNGKLLKGLGDRVQRRILNWNL